MHRIAHWLSEFPFTLIAALWWPISGAVSFATNNFASLAQVANPEGTWSGIIYLFERVGYPAGVTGMAFLALRELWTFFKPLIKGWFNAHKTYLEAQTANSRKLSDLLEQQGDKQDRNYRALRRQGRMNSQHLEKLLHVAASGVGALTGKDTVSVIDHAIPKPTEGEPSQ